MVLPPPAAGAEVEVAAGVEVEVAAGVEDAAATGAVVDVVVEDFGAVVVGAGVVVAGAVVVTALVGVALVGVALVGVVVAWLCWVAEVAAADVEGVADVGAADVEAGEDGTDVGVVDAALGLVDSGLVAEPSAGAELDALVGGTVAGTSSVADGGTV